MCTFRALLHLLFLLVCAYGHHLFVANHGVAVLEDDLPLEQVLAEDIHALPPTPEGLVVGNESQSLLEAVLLLPVHVDHSEAEVRSGHALNAEGKLVGLLTCEERSDEQNVVSCVGRQYIALAVASVLAPPSPSLRFWGGRRACLKVTQGENRYQRRWSWA